MGVQVPLLSFFGVGDDFELIERMRLADASLENIFLIVGLELVESLTRAQPGSRTRPSYRQYKAKPKAISPHEEEFARIARIIFRSICIAQPCVPRSTKSGDQLARGV